ncbi:MAG: hypothetical protein LLG97_05545 [Deltaproteobacteria bacterium]|nr:hypothetical protein [Deltaproteobacteria bacterium]
MATRRAEAANPSRVDDVRARKPCIANGCGVVRGANVLETTAQCPGLMAPAKLT